MSLDFIFRRRSIRQYADRPVEDYKVTQILEAAMAAPSAHNARPWHFVMVTESAQLTALAEIHPYGKMLTQAALAIAVCADPRKSPDHWPQDCSAATQNILLALPALGLGGVWLACYPNHAYAPKIKAELNIPDNIALLSMVSIGYPSETKPARTQYQAERVHWDRW